MSANSLTNSLFHASAAQNKTSYLNYCEKLIQIALSMFEWHDLPDTCDERFLELQLLEKGYCLFFADEIMGYLTLPCTIGGRLNVYNIPMQRRAYASNGYQNEKTEADSVIIYNNTLHTNDYIMIENYAKRLWKIDQIIGINANAQKTPLLIACDEKQRLTLKNLYQKYDGNQPFIFGDKSLTTTVMQAINTGAPYVADKLYQLRTDIYNEALTFLGVSNIQIQKKERLITDEVQQMNGGVVSGRQSRLQARQQACDQINKMFGLSISVTVRENGTEKENNPDPDNSAKIEEEDPDNE